MICDRIPKLNKCCCCVNLRLGGLIIAVFVTVFSIISLVGGAGVVANLEKDNADYNAELTGAIITLGLACLDVILAVYLFFGIITNRYHWLLPYLWIRGVLLAIYFILAIAVFFYNIGAAIVLLVGFLISLYFWMCLQSLYQEMKGQ